MNWNIVFLVVIVGIAGFIWYDVKQDGLVEQQDALERQKQRELELEAELERQQQLLAEERQKQQQSRKNDQAKFEDEIAIERMNIEARLDRLQEKREERVEKLDKELQMEKAKQEFNNRTWARQTYQECLRDTDDPDRCPHYNELLEQSED